MAQPLPVNLCDTRGGHGTLNRIYEVLGGRGRSLPKALKGKFNVDGHTVIVFPSSSTKERRFGRAYKTKHISGRKYGLTRVFFLVGRGRLIPAGRINQSAFCGGTGGRGRKRLW